MTTDKQRLILEAAAKACGITLDFTVRGDFPPYYINERGGHSSWNPLTNPGDTAEMCAKLGIGNRWYLFDDFVVCGPSYNNVTAYFKDHDNSRLKAWMAAATMVAAKLGGYKE